MTVKPQSSQKKLQSTLQEKAPPDVPFELEQSKRQCARLEVRVDELENILENSEEELRNTKKMKDEVAKGFLVKHFS